MALSSPIDWTTVEIAIHAWFSSATGLPVIWEDQEAPRPPLPYGTLKVIAGPTKLFGADEHRITYDGNQPDGEEIGIEVAGLRQMTVTAQVFLKRLGANGSSGAKDYTTRAQSALGMPSYLAGLQAAGLSVIEEMAPRDLSGVDSGTWLARSAMDVRFGLAASVTERTGYVETVGLEPTYRGPDGEVLEYLSREFDIEAAGDEMRTLLDTTVTFTSAMAQWGAAGPRFDKMYLTTAGGLIQSAQPTVPPGTTFQVNQSGPESIILSLQTVGGATAGTADGNFIICLFGEIAFDPTDNSDHSFTAELPPGNVGRFARPLSEHPIAPSEFYDQALSFPGVVVGFQSGLFNYISGVSAIETWKQVSPLPYVRFGFCINNTPGAEPPDWVDWPVKVRIYGIPMTYKR